MNTSATIFGQTTRALVFTLMGIALLATANEVSAQQRKSKPRGTATINDSKSKFRSGQQLQAKTSRQVHGSKTVQAQQGGSPRVMAAVIEEPVVVPDTQWALIVNGWFDYEGLNIEHVPYNSPLLRLNSRWDRRGQRYKLEPGDVITHVDGQPVTNYDDYFYALNFASNPRNVQIEVLNWRDGSKLRLWASAQKIR